MNILLYASPGSKITRVLLGLHRIYTEETQRKGRHQRQTPNFNIVFSSPKVFRHLSEYFGAVAEGAMFDKATSLDECDRKSRMLLFQAKFRSFMSRVLALCSSNTNILHCSVFGYSAMYQEGVEYVDEFKTDLGVDLIIVCAKGEKESVREDIKQNSLIHEYIPFKFNLVWGDDPSDFYTQREADSFTVDVEIFEEGDNFFRQHPLLGHSILASCVAVYQQNPFIHRLHQLMAGPKIVPTTNERLLTLLNDRKGLYDFLESIKKHKGKCDPRRVCAHVVRNLGWAWSGAIYSSYEKASEMLLTLPEAKTLYSDLCKCKEFMSQERDCNKYEREYRNTVALIKSVIDVCKASSQDDS